MFETFRSMWRIRDLRKKVLYTLMMLLIYRLASVVPAPGINMAELANQTSSSLPLLDMMNMMTGNAFNQMTIMAMGITPYINSSIIMQLLTVAIPYLENLQKQGEEGKKKINSITRYVTIVLAAVQAIGLVSSMRLINPGAFNLVLVGVSMAGGTALAMWLGERVTQNGVGNGISLLIFSGIVSNLFNGVTSGVRGALSADSTVTWMNPVMIIIVLIIMIVVVTFVDKGERRFNVHYAKRVVGNRMMGGQSTQFPLKVNSSGVLPLIFAYSFIAFPGTIMQLASPNGNITRWWSQNMAGAAPIHLAVTFLLIIGFTFFYSSIGVDYREVAKNITKNGGTITGVRGGKQTADALIRSNRRLTLFTAFFLGVLSTIPTLLTSQFKIAMPFAASSLLIGVSVALETSRQIEYELLRHHHKGITR